MARQDERSRNNRKRVDTTREITRPVTKTKTVQKQTKSTDTLDNMKWVQGADKSFKDKVDSSTYDSIGYSLYKAGGDYNEKVDYDSPVGYSVHRAGGSYVHFDADGNRITDLKEAKGEGGSDVWSGKVHKYGTKDVEQSYTDYQTETRGSSRMQALDKLSSDDDAQKNRKLKTKREGRNKLRISLAGDGSSGRLRDGPNSGRQKNKLKIDVQGAGGSSGLNIPR